MSRLVRLPSSPVEGSIGARAFVFAAFVVAVAGIVVYGEDYVVPVVAIVIAAAGHVVSYRERSLKRGFWRQVLLATLVLGALFYVIADSSLALFGGVLPQANFAILLVAITSFDLKSRRNCYSSLWISIAILYLAAVYAWDYPFAIVLALWTVCLAGFWVASHLRRHQAQLRLPVRAVAIAGTSALVAGVGVFLVSPQPSGAPVTPQVVSLPSFTSFKGDIESPALPLVQLTADPTGATSSVDLHFRGRLGDTPVMYVRTAAPAYWRGLVFDRYQGGVWTASIPGFSQMQPYVPPRFLPAAPADNLGTFVQTFRVLRTMPGVIYAAYPLESLYAPVAALREDAYGAFHTPEQLHAGETYSVVSYVPNLSSAVLRPDISFDPDDMSVYRDVGPLSIRAAELARTITAGIYNRYDRVMALTTYLQHNYRYTLDLPPVPSGRDPVDWFLFDVKTGYCEQFATAETLMLRSLGIPARLVTGYSTGDYDSMLDQAVVRERDAHAWTEVWFAHHGWVPVDPTPGVSPLAATQFPSHWAAGGVARLIPHLTVGAPASPLGSIGALALVPTALGIAVVFAVVYAWLRRRRWVPRPKAQPGEEELLRLYERLQRRLGRRRAPPETPLEYQRSIDSALLEEVTRAVNEGAYAGRWPEARRVREMAQRIS